MRNIHSVLLKKHIVLIFSLFMSCSMLACATPTQRLLPTTQNTIIVDDDGLGDYTTIQAAIDNATTGDLIRVWDGVYTENITINKTVELQGNQSATTILNGIGTNNSVITVFADDVSISGLTIQQGDFVGIQIAGSTNVLIEHTLIQSNTYGIWILIGTQHRISKNTMQNNTEQALSISLGLKNEVTQNNFIQNSVGKEVGHAFFWNSFFTTWDANYWDTHTESTPKKIEGQINPIFTIVNIPLAWANFDWNPQETPYEY